MTIRTALAGATATVGIVVAAAGCTSVGTAAPTPASTSGTPAPADFDRDVETKEKDCNQTESDYHEKGYVYLYRYENCKGAHDARDKSDADSDYGDGEGQVKDFDNRTDSIVNTTTSHVKFYNYPNYNKNAGDKGDSFCVGPGEWVTRLQFYGDGDGDHGWWKNSISSHRKVSEDECGRWFGWGSDR